MEYEEFFERYGMWELKGEPDAFTVEGLARAIEERMCKRVSGECGHMNSYGEEWVFNYCPDCGVEL